MSGRMIIIGVAVVLAGAGSLFAQPRVDERKVEPWHTNVKTWTEFKTNGGYHSGEVVQVGEGKVTVRCNTFTKGRTVLRDVYPVDLLAVGKIVDSMSANYAYRWSDIQKGDIVDLRVIHDHGEDRDYCFGVCICRRPGTKLPESQKPKKDTRYARDSLFNDIDNGEDVSDDDIAKVLPATPYNPKTRTGGDPGGLPKEYQDKLDAIREKAKKKEKDLKATPPEKEKK